MFKNKEKDGFSFTLYTGDSAVLLAFNLDDSKIKNLAGFAVKCKTPHIEIYKTDTHWLKNRLNFTKPLTSKMTLTPDEWTESDKAPFQTFHWTHFPSAGPGGNYTYTAYPMYFNANNPNGLDQGTGLSIDVDLNYRICSNLELGFTRGYISSQAYADRFKNAPIQPEVKSMDFDTTPYEEQYIWLGSHARKILFDLLAQSKDDESIDLDVFAFDFNLPDMIRDLCVIGSRVRVFLDDSKSHIAPNALEPHTHEALDNAGVSVKTGCFGRFAHDKVIIQKKDGVPIKVLTGSANFSIRGLYVQANSILLFSDPGIAKLYEDAFEQAFNNMNGFKKSAIASRWYSAKLGNGSSVSISFAPHKTAFSLDRIAEAMESAQNSIFFAMMEIGGSGPVMQILQDLGTRTNLFSLGTIEKNGELKLFKPGKTGQPPVTSFAYLREKEPSTFKEEISGGPGQVIHHKFVVCDFNQTAPIVFCGSSNMAKGGEISNGDNLIAIQDSDTAICYAIEAIRLYDHYRFRSKQAASTSNNPLSLVGSDTWTEPFYNEKDIKFLERTYLSIKTDDDRKTG